MSQIKSIVALLPMGKVFDPVYEAISSSAVQIDATAARAESELSAENKLGQLCAGKFSRFACRSDTRAKEGFVGIDIAYAVQQLLVQKRRFDRCIAIAK